MRFWRSKGLHTNRWVRLALTLGWIVLALVAVALLSNNLTRDWKRLLDYRFTSRPQFLIPALGWYSLAMVALLLNWRLMLRCVGVHTAFWHDIPAYCYSFLCSAIPGGFWSVFSLFYFYDRVGVPKVKVVVAVAIEQLTLLLAALLLSLVAVPLTIGAQVGVWGYSGVAVAAALVAALCTPRVWRRVQHMLARLPMLAPITEVRLPYSTLLKSVLLQIVVVVASSQVVYSLANVTAGVSANTIPAIIASWSAITVVSSLCYWVPGSTGLQLGVTILTLGSILPAPTLVATLIALRLSRIAGGLLWAAATFLLVQAQRLFTTRH